MAIALERIAGETDAAYIDRLKAQLAAAPTPGQLTVKITKSGAIGIYGMRARFPTPTLFANEWEKLFPLIPTVQKFIKQYGRYTAKKGEDYMLPARTKETEAIFSKSAWDVSELE